VSLLAWILAGYPWPICLAAALPLLAPLRGLVRGSRHTYAWATLFTIPYFAFAVTELLANPRARWVAAMSLLLHYDFVPACFSSASRMKGIVRRRCSTSEASSSASSIWNSVGKSRGMRFSKYSEVS
jgi:uncharacterized membrane protein